MGRWEFGYVDRHGSLVVPHGLRIAQRFEDGFAVAAPFEHDKLGILAPSGAWLVEPTFDFHGGRAAGALAVNVGGRWVEGRIQGGRWGLVTEAGLTVAPRFEELGMPGDGLAPFAENGLWGYATLTGEVVVPPRFEWAGTFTEGFAPVAIGGRDRYLRKDGTFAMEATFDQASSWSGGRGRVKREGRWHLVDAQGESLSEAFDEIWPFLDGMAKVRRGKQFSFVGENGQLLTPELFDETRVWADGLAPVRRGKDWFFLSSKGALIGPYETAMTPNEGRARFVPHGGDGVGFLGVDGNVVIPPTFQTAQGFVEGLAPVKREGKWTWIDPSGREIAPPRWDGVGVFGKDGVAVVREGVRFGLVDREARELVSPRFGALGAMSYGLSRAQALDETKPHAPPATWAALPTEGLAFAGFEGADRNTQLRVILGFSPAADEATLTKASRILNLWTAAMEERADGARVTVGEPWLVSYAFALRITNVPEPVAALQSLVDAMASTGLPIQEAVFGAFRDDPTHPREWNLMTKVVPAVPHPDDPRGSAWFSSFDEYWDAVWSEGQAPASESLQHLRAGRWNPRTQTHVFDERIFTLHHPKVRIAYGVLQAQGMFAAPGSVDEARREAVLGAVEGAMRATFDREKIWVFPGNKQWQPPIPMDRDWNLGVEVIEHQGRRGYYFAVDAPPLLHDVGPDAFRYREPELMSALAQAVEQLGLAPVILWQRFGDPLNLPSMVGTAHPMNPTFYLVELWEK
ncbi:MAG: WG repeat-containing protein [Sandaracinus sp.]|nr:WG repeat-containing protein [Sandaracinus sp.]